MAFYDDPRILRAIAHPTRNRVLHELSASGSLRAADIARRIDIPANQASFHLRQLAKYGLVEEDPDAARDRRDRVWRMVDDEISFRPSEVFEQPGGRAAYGIFRRNAVEWGKHLVERAHTADPAESDRRHVSESSLLLSDQEAVQLMAELSEVIRRHAANGRAKDDGTQRETWSVYTLVQPYPELHTGDE